MPSYFTGLAPKLKITRQGFASLPYLYFVLEALFFLFLLHFIFTLCFLLLDSVAFKDLICLRSLPVLPQVKPGSTLQLDALRQLLSQILAFICVYLGLGFWVYRRFLVRMNPPAYVKPSKPRFNPYYSVALGVACGFALAFFAYCLYIFLPLHFFYNKELEGLAHLLQSYPQLWLFFFIGFAVLIPIFEEIFYRNYFQGYLLRYALRFPRVSTRVFAPCISAFFFTLSHTQIPFLALLWFWILFVGFVFAAIYQGYGLGASIGAHIAYNQGLFYIM